MHTVELMFLLVMGSDPCLREIERECDFTFEVIRYCDYMNC